MRSELASSSRPLWSQQVCSGSFASLKGLLLFLHLPLDLVSESLPKNKILPVSKLGICPDTKGDLFWHKIDHPKVALEINQSKVNKGFKLLHPKYSKAQSSTTDLSLKAPDEQKELPWNHKAPAAHYWQGGAPVFFFAGPNLNQVSHHPWHCYDTIACDNSTIC